MQFFTKVFAAVALFAVAASAMPASDLEIETRSEGFQDGLVLRQSIISELDIDDDILGRLSVSVREGFGLRID